MVKIYYQNQCVAQHLRSDRMGGYSTQVEHMPKAHQDYAKWSPERLKQWAGKLGDYVLQWVEYKLASKAHPQQSYKVCFGLLSLSKTYPKERLNAACQRGDAPLDHDGPVFSKLGAVFVIITLPQMPLRLLLQLENRAFTQSNARAQKKNISRIRDESAT